MAFGTVRGDSLPFEKWPEAVDVDVCVELSSLYVLGRISASSN